MVEDCWDAVATALVLLAVCGPMAVILVVERAEFLSDASQSPHELEGDLSDDAGSGCDEGDPECADYVLSFFEALLSD